MADGLIAIVGPTASGKSALAVAVALRTDSEIISMDSRQVYRGMDIGTAQPTPAEQGGVVHHGLDLVTPDERYSAGRFARDARGWLEQIRRRGRTAVLAGGTGFFLRALMSPLFDEPALDAAVRDRLDRFLQDLPATHLARWATALDPVGADRVGDRQRHARLVEVALLTGRPLSWWHEHAAPAAAPVTPAVFVLDVPRDVLVQRIEARVDAMIAAGLADEVRGLLDAGYDERDPGMNATGYIEMIPHVRGTRSLDEAAAMIRTATRQYARRQRTWLRNQLPPTAWWLDGGRPLDALADDMARTGVEEMA
ncbi:tRNA (adenosine(37)-N6)-dimethylallyltransferase MiaA [soil metagenome]